jgi:hypothetical protein
MSCAYILAGVLDSNRTSSSSNRSDNSNNSKYKRKTLCL